MALSNATGQISARYRYDAFGKTILSTDVDGTGWNTKNIHGFSTKPTLGNHKLHYYGYRWYDASNGRWINKDPIEEQGGLNLYGFVGNDGVGVIDYLGNNAVCAPAAAGLTAAGVALAFGLTVTECMQDPACSEAVNKLNDPTICIVAIWGAATVVQEGVKKGACCCIDKVNGLLRWGARSAKQVACMASCNAVFLAVDKVCDSLPGKYRTKCHADALKDLKDCLAKCK
jgi:RHS repeat-associated protein